jgi:hypothetical protein
VLRARGELLRLSLGDFTDVSHPPGNVRSSLVNSAEADKVPPSYYCCVFNFEHFRKKKQKSLTHPTDVFAPNTQFAVGKADTAEQGHCRFTFKRL